ncbi:MFS transporter [Microbacterium sp. MPKO10]|uniref:MFS transporter n=1 Tax=Microbacterium sp. MPKO10 TaxID=2989818 RepID=UPI0022361E66|nr:MFS transporter [Microbacterium sp. MPKO10]MCW4457972.1 MFS transporter [Microbacterium sp. MPKO10]
MVEANPVEPEGHGPRRRAAARPLLLAAATFVVVLDLAGIVILLPSIQAEFGSGIAESTWVVAAFVIVAAAAIPVGARATAILDARSVLLAGLLGFGLASAVAAFAPTISVLLAARAAQGLGAGLVEPAVHRLVRGGDTGPDAKQATQTQALAALLAAALGPVLPAALAAATSWRALFGLDVVLAVVTAAAVWRALPPARAAGGRSSVLMRDALEAVIAAAAAATLFFAVIDGARLDASPVALAAALVIALGLLAALAVAGARRRRPLLLLRLLRRRRFAAGNVVRGLTEFASLGVFFPLSGYLQDDLGHSPLSAGLLLMPIVLGALFTAPVAERYAGRVHAAWFLVPGLVCTAAGVVWLGHVTPGMPWWFVLAPLAIVGAGIGAVESPAEAVVASDTPAGAEEAAWSLGRMFYLLGIGAGVAVVSAVWQAIGVDVASGVNSALLVCAAAALVGAAIAAVGTIGHSRATS